MRALLAALVGAGALAQTPKELDARVGEALRARYGETRRCYDLALADDGHKGGTVALVLSIEAGGRVSGARVVENGVGDARMADCLTRTLATFTIAGMKEAADVAVPLRFDPPPRQYVVRYEDAPARPILGGKGEARVLLDAKTVGATEAAMSVLTLKPGAKVPLHLHPNSAEIIYILKGTGCMRGPKGEWRGVGAGDWITISPGSAHAFYTTGGEPVEAVQVYLPGGPEQRFRDPKKTAGTVPVNDGEPPPPGEEPTYLRPVGMGVKFLPGPRREAPMTTLLFVFGGRRALEAPGQTIEIGPGSAVYLPPGEARLSGTAPLDAFVLGVKK